MQTIDNWSTPIKEMLSCHEMFRTIGFAPEHLFLELFNNPPGLGFLMDNGEHTFRINIDLGNMTVKQAQDEWKVAVVWWNQTTDNASRIAIFRSSRAYQHRVNILAALSSKGIPFHANPAPPPQYTPAGMGKN